MSLSYTELQLPSHAIVRPFLPTMNSWCSQREGPSSTRMTCLQRGTSFLTETAILRKVFKRAQIRFKLEVFLCETPRLA